MPNGVGQADTRNHILAGLSAADFAVVSPYLDLIELVPRRYLERSGRRVQSIFFIEEGLVSVTAVARPSGRQAGVGLIGVEGMTGFSFLHDVERAPYDVLVQMPGWAYAVDADRLRRFSNLSRTLRAPLLHYYHTFYLQTGTGALAHATGSVEERLSRWLLMTHDRLPGDELKITHDLFAAVLGVRRPGITIGLRRLEQEGLIALSRGSTMIMDRDGLIKRTNGLYGVPEAEYERLLGRWRRPPA